MTKKTGIGTGPCAFHGTSSLRPQAKDETIEGWALLLLLRLLTTTATLPSLWRNVEKLQTSGEFLERISIVQPVLVAEPSRVPRVGVSTVAATTSLRGRWQRGQRSWYPCVSLAAIWFSS